MRGPEEEKLIFRDALSPVYFKYPFSLCVFL